jgi:alpha-glucosidase (family GH31 glycosyl hydrolase)
MSTSAQSSFVFAGMKNHESIAMGGRITCSSARSLELEWLLYPQALEGCPNPYHWDYGAPPLEDSSFRAHGFEVILRADPPRATLRQPSSGLELHIDDITLSREDGRATATIQGGVDARYYGLGEQFASLEHSGRRIVCESSDWWNKSWFDPPGWKHSYAPIPFLLTTAGYGLLVRGTSRVTFDLRQAGASGGPGSYRVEIESPTLRITVVPGGSLKEILRAFVELTGKPYVPPRWALEPLLACACNHRERCWTESRLDEYIEMFRKHRLPNGMVMDEAWIWTRRDATSPTGHHMHYEQYGAFEPDNYDHPAEAIRRLEREGRSRMIFIIGPFIGCKSKFLDMLRAKGWLVRRASNPEHLLMGQYNHYFLDFTHPEAVAWWKERLGEVLDLGVSGFFACAPTIPSGDGCPCSQRDSRDPCARSCVDR